MRYPPSVLEEIKSRLPPSAVVGRRVKLQKAGREWKGLSPFNKERTPSFFVNDQKLAWFDFSSGRNGDIFGFLMEVEGLSFGEAVERLAAEAGVTLPKPDADSEVREKRRAGLGEAMDIAAAFFRDELRGARGREARDYLARRGLSGPVAEKFGLGYAPGDRHALRDHLAEKGVPLEIMIEAGLLIAGDDIPVPYDRFRDRVMFPIHDARGRLIAFGGRALQKDAQAKYLNSPETPLFHKGATLFNLHRARKAAHDKGRLFVVEGYVDAIALDRAEVAEAVAPLGTALTEDQLGLLWRVVPEPVLCFDGDKAGLRAAYRAIDVAMPGVGPGRSLRFAFLPEGLDPDDFLRERGPEALRAALESPRPLVDVLFERETTRGPLDTPEQRAECEKRLFGAVQPIADEDLKRHYRQALRERLNRLFQPARNEARAVRGRRDGRFERGNPPAAPLVASEGLRRSALFRVGSGLPPREAALVLAVAHHPSILDAEAEAFAELVFESPVSRRVRAALLDLAAAGFRESLLPPDGLAGALAERGLAGDYAQLRAAAHAEPMAAPGGDRERDLSAWREAMLLHARQSFLHSEIAEVSADFARNGDPERFERLRALVQRREARLETTDGEPSA